MVPSNKDGTRFFAFGRIFSGTVSLGQKVIIMGANHTKGSKDDIFTNKPVQRTAIMMGRKAESVSSVPCGNTCALGGVDQYLAKSGTVTSESESFPLVNMKYRVSPVVRVAVEPKNPVDLPKLVEALKLLSKADPLVVCSMESTGEHIVACAGQLHMDISINDLKDYMKGAELNVGQPMVSFMETVTAASVPSLAKSPNHHNRLYAMARPLEEGLPEAIEEARLGPKDEPKETARKLVEQFNWDPTDAKKIWCFGPEGGTNILVDTTRGLQYMNEIRDSVEAAFKWAAHEGAMAMEPMRGVRFSLVDATLHPDAIHRGGGQIIPAARRVFYASQLQAQPRLMEPIFLVEINCPNESINGVYNVLSQRRGEVIEVLDNLVKAYLPVMQSFDFTEALRGATSGGVFPQCVFFYWKTMPEDPLDPQSTKMRELIGSIRKRKGQAPEIPPLDRFLDKL
jgi:elongation factor 2